MSDPVSFPQAGLISNESPSASMPYLTGLTPHAPASLAIELTSPASSSGCPVIVVTDANNTDASFALVHFLQMCLRLQLDSSYNMHRGRALWVGCDGQGSQHWSQVATRAVGIARILLSAGPLLRTVCFFSGFEPQRIFCGPSPIYRCLRR